MSSISSPHTQQLTLCTSTENVPKVDEKEKKINSCIKGAGSWKTNITALMEKKKALERALHGAIQQQINASISNEMSPNVHQQGVSSLNTPPSSVSQAPQELPHFLSATLPSQGFHRRNTTYELTTSSNLPHRDPFAGLNSPVPWTQPDQHVRLERAHSCFNEVLHSPSQWQHQCNNIFSTIRTGSVVMLQRHLASGIYSVHMRDNQEATPLHIAAYEDREDMSIVLISYGADVFALDKKRRTPKDLANPSSGVARLLLSAMEMREKNLVVAGVASATVPDILVESRRKGHSVTRNFGRLLSCPSVLEEHMTGETATPTGGVTTATSASGGKILTNVISSYSVPSNSKGLGLAQRIAVPCEVPYALTTTGGSVDGLFSTMEGSHINSTSSADSVPKGTTDQFQQFDMNMKSISEQLRGDVRSVFSEEPERERLQMRLQEVHSCNCTVYDNQSLIICLVGLPGRGKSFISKRISRYLNWNGVPCRVFNAGDFRRQLLGAEETAMADFYDPDNENGKQQRDKMAQLAMEDLARFVESSPLAVGILDATNTTVERRRHVLEYFMLERFKGKDGYYTVSPDAVSNWRTGERNETKIISDNRRDSTAKEDKRGDNSKGVENCSDTELSNKSHSTVKGSERLVGRSEVSAGSYGEDLPAALPPCDRGAKADNASCKGPLQKQPLRRRVPKVMFIESVCQNEDIITENILRAKCTNNDFKSVQDPIEVIRMFRSRILQYEKVYETCTPDELVPSAVSTSVTPSTSPSITYEYHESVQRSGIISEIDMYNEEGSFGESDVSLPLTNITPTSPPFIKKINFEDDENSNTVSNVRNPLYPNPKSISFIKIKDVKENIVLHRVRGGLPSKVAFFLMNLHPIAFPIFITLPGETVGDAAGKFGGDYNLTPRGEEYSKKLRYFIQQRLGSVDSRPSHGGGMTNIYHQPSCPYNGNTKAMMHVRDSDNVEDGEIQKDKIKDDTNRMEVCLERDNTPTSRVIYVAGKPYVVIKGKAYPADTPEAQLAMSQYSDSELNASGDHGYAVSPLTILTSTDASVDATMNIALYGHEGVHSSAAAKGQLGEAMEEGNSSFQSGASSKNSSFYTKYSDSVGGEDADVNDIPCQCRYRLKRVRALNDLRYGQLTNCTEEEGRLKHPKTTSKLFTKSGVYVDEQVDADHGSERGHDTSASLPHDHLSNTTTRQAIANRGTTKRCIKMPQLAFSVSFPNGESHWQCSLRLEPSILEIIRADGPIIVVAPLAPAQGLLAFLTDVLPERSPELDIPRHRVVEIGVKGQVVIHEL